MRFAIAAFGLAAIATAHEISYDTPPAPAAYAPAKNETTVAPVCMCSLHGGRRSPRNLLRDDTARLHMNKANFVTTRHHRGRDCLTNIEHNGVTYTVTEATTLTIPCPTGCMVQKPVYSSVVTVCSTCTTAPAAPTYPAETPVSPVQPPAPHYPAKNETAPPAYNPGPTAPVGTGVYSPPASTSPIAPGYTGAATKASFGIAGVLAAAGFIAAL
ncbi:hypothetical protein Slin14017_G062080 [Septoria linicola]|nr:hypothetical protein Slin14017_G062080 [Septoria linicola]